MKSMSELLTNPPVARPVRSQSEVIRRMRGALALRQADVSRATGVSEQVISALENGAADRVMGYLRDELTVEATAAAARRRETQEERQPVEGAV
jgi:predicted transcriptional regulator